MSPLARLVALPVRGYRLLASPWVGHGCRFQPTCSAYALDALARHGAERFGAAGAALALVMRRQHFAWMAARAFALGLLALRAGASEARLVPVLAETPQGAWRMAVVDGHLLPLEDAQRQQETASVTRVSPMDSPAPGTAPCTSPVV